MRRLAALGIALSLSGCATVSDVGADMLSGAAHGAIQGLRIVPIQACSDPCVCTSIVTVTVAGGALVGGLRGLGQGLTRAQLYWY